MVKKDNIFSPWSVTLAVWIVEITLFVTLNHGLFPTTGNFETGVFSWVVPFCVTSYFAYKQVKSNTPIRPHEYNKRIFNIMLILSVLFVPIALYTTYKFVMANALSDNLFFNLRYYANKDETESPLKYIAHVALIPLLAECNRLSINKKRFILLFLLNILLGLSSMAKTSLFTVIITTCFILTYNGKIKKSIFVYIFLGFIGLCVVFSGLRSYSGDSEEDTSGVIATYLLSPIAAFDKAAFIHHIQYDGSSTFRFFYQLMKSLGANVDVKRTVQEFILIPTPTNVYTIFYQYYLDFGYIGIVVFGIIDGLIYGYVYGKINDSPSYKLFYAYLFVSLCLQFFNEIFFVTFSIVIQIFVLSYIVYYNTRKIKSYG
jgi:oligosaccharide repeat unit polymerase